MTELKKRFLFILILCVSVSFSLYGKKITSLEGLSKPRMIAIKGGKLFVSDLFGVKVFCMNDFKLIKELGEKGQGPGEFGIFPTIRFNGDQLVLIDKSQNKIVKYSKDLQFKEEKKFAFSFFDFIHFKNKYIIQQATWDKKERENSAFYILNKDFKKEKTISQRIVEKGQSLTFRAATWKDKIYVLDESKGFNIDVYDQQGKSIFQITKKYQITKTTEAHNKAHLETIRTFVPSYRKKPLSFWKLPETIPMIKDFFIIEGKLYIKTSIIKEAKEEYIIMDLKGKELKRVYVPVAVMHFFTFQGDNFFYLRDNPDEEEWELHKIQI